MNSILNARINQVSRDLATTSNKYQFVRTADIVEQLTNQGWLVDSVQGPRRKGASEFGRHIVKMSHPIYSRLTGLENEGKAQVILDNSHNGMSSFRFLIGFYRYVCQNGLMVGRTYDSLYFRHVGQIPNVIQCVSQIVKGFETMANDIQRMHSTKANASMFSQLVDTISQINSYNDQNKLVLNYSSSLETLWQLYNDVQEQLIKGQGTRVQYNEQKQRWTQRKARPVNNVQLDIKLNQELYNTALSLVA